MWSGPRNLSTAMMYSFGARPDCAVWDEPFYAAYLLASGADHPMREEVIKAHETRVSAIVEACKGAIPQGKSVYYMKHMPHHMAEGFPLDWARSCVNVHLIRHPARVIASYLAKRDTVTMHDIGFEDQMRIFNELEGIVIDSADIREKPAEMLQVLCEAIGISYMPHMLSWPKGGRAEDGVWSAHWYGALHNSTGFSGPESALPDVPRHLSSLYQEALALYEQLSAKKLRL